MYNTDDAYDQLNTCDLNIVFKPVSDINTVFLHDYTDFFDPALGSLDENKLGDEFKSKKYVIIFHNPLYSLRIMLIL